MIKANIFNIQRFCVNDGPGIRTTVFIKGCGLDCAWCHNPESKSFERELMFSDSLCIMCKACETVCENGVHSFSEKGHLLDREKCTLCGKCTDICPAEAVELAGKQMSVDEVMETVLRDVQFYENSGGGMTLSGGEPLHSFEFSYELLKAAKENGIHTCIETSGYADTGKILKIAEFTDLFLYDFKISDETLHKKYTGVGNELIKKNLLALDKFGNKMVLRCPIIPGVNDNASHFDGIAETANSLANIVGIDIEPYHALGVTKLSRLGKDAMASFEVPVAGVMEKWVKYLQNKTKVTVKIG